MPKKRIEECEGHNIYCYVLCLIGETALRIIVKEGKRDICVRVIRFEDDKNKWLMQ